MLDFVNTRRIYKLFINMIKLPTNVFKAPGQRVEHILLYGGGPILIARDFAVGSSLISARDGRSNQNKI